MAKTRTQKAALNTATAAVSEIILFICGLILPRLIIGTYGSAYNGITASAKQFLSAVSILNVGIAGTTRVALYRSLADRDIARTSAFVRATEIYMRKVGIVLAAFTLILASLYPLFVETGYTWSEVSILIVAAGIGTFGQYFFGTAYAALLSADQCVYITNIFAIAATVLNTVVSVILIKLGCSIQVVKLGGAFVFFLRPLLQNVYVTHRYKIDKKCEPDNSALALRRDVMAHSIANIVHDHTDMVVLTIFCGVKIVSVYNVYALVMSALKKMQTVFTSGTEAIYGNMWAQGEKDRIRMSLGYYEFFVTSFISVVFSTALVMILSFITLYVQGVHDVEYVLPTYSVVITIAQAYYCMRAPYLTLVQGAGHYKQTKKGAYFEAGLNLVSSIVLVQFIGIVGVAVGTLLANVFRTLQYAVYIDRNLVKRGMLVFMKRVIWTAANVALVYFLAIRFVECYAVNGWLWWIGCAALTIAFAFMVTLLSAFIFYRKDMVAFVKIVKRVLQKKTSKGAAT